MYVNAVWFFSIQHCESHQNELAKEHQDIETQHLFMFPVCRAFVVENFAEIKRANPYFPFLVREAAGAEAKLIARFGE